MQSDVRQAFEGAPPIKEAVVTNMMRASEKLRPQKSLCKKIRVSIGTGMFNPEVAKYANGVVDLLYPTDDVRLLTKTAVEALDCAGLQLQQSGSAVVELVPGEYTDDLFAISQPAEATRAMAVLDQINGRWVEERSGPPVCLSTLIGACAGK